VTSVSAWTVSRVAAARGPRRTARAAGDPFIDQLAATGRLAVTGLYQATLPARRGVEDQPLVLDVATPDGGDYVVVVRHASGALTFAFAERIAGRRSARGAREATGALRFRIQTRSTDASSDRRGIGAKLLRIAVAKVLGRVIDAALPGLAKAWEQRAWRKRGLAPGLHRVGLGSNGLFRVTPIRTAAALPAGRKLLFIHGTFSNFAGGFGALANAQGGEGSTFFEAVRDLYGDQVFALEHFTVSATPLENAQALLDALPDAGGPFDVVTHSRGALVLRSIGLCANAGRLPLGNAVLVGAPNQGTPLAAPDRLETFTSWLANLLEVLPDNPFTFGVEFLVEAVAWLAQKAGDVIPGIAPMNPGGRFLRDLAAGPTPAGRLSALVSNYEPDASLLARMADAGVDGFFGGANDLVVPSEGGWHVDIGSELTIAAARIGCFGPGGNLGASGGNGVIHTKFFSQPEAVDFLARAVRGEDQRLALIDPTRPLPTSRERRRAGETATDARRGPAAEGAPPRARDVAPFPDPPPQRRDLVSAAAGSRSWRAAAGYPLDEVFHLFIVAPDEVLAAGPAASPELGMDADFARRVQRSTKAKHAIVIATFRNARVVEAFDTGGKRWHDIIAMQERIKSYIAGDSRQTLPDAEELRKYGELLFDALFPREARRLYDAARAELVTRRLDVCLTSMIGWVADKPWEFAFDPTRRMFLCMEEVNLLRNVVTAVPADAPTPRRRSLRILVVAAQPIGATHLSVEEETRVILRGFRSLIDSGLAEVDVISRITPGALHEHLSVAEVRQTPYDILHFIGHGEFNDASGMGELIFEDAEGRKQTLAADVFRQIVGRRSLRLVFLNACETGMGIGGELDFTRGVAPMLIAGGVPAVVANQYAVLDPSATAFAQHFYWALACGRRVGDAAREARVAVSYSITGEAIDWAVPVLFARDPAETLVAEFEISPTGARERAAAAPSTPSRRRTIGKRTRVGVWDVNHIAPRLEELLERLNRAQSVYEFIAVEITAPIGTWRRSTIAGRTAFLNAEEVEQKLSEAPARLGVDHLCALTTFALSGGKTTNLSTYFDPDLGISIVSTFGRLERLDPPKTSLERLIANHLAFSLSDLEEHKRGVKQCPGYYNQKNDIRWIAGPLAFCRACRRRLGKKPAVLEALSAILLTADGSAPPPMENAMPGREAKALSKPRARKRRLRP
jgi:hypothetical protein